MLRQRLTEWWSGINRGKLGKRIEFPRPHLVSNNDLISVFIVCLVIVFFIIFSGFALAKNIDTRKLQMEKIAQVNQEIEFWSKIAEKHRDYRDAYYQLAVLNYRIGETEKSKIFLKKVFLLDPNFKEGRKLEKILNRY